MRPDQQKLHAQHKEGLKNDAKDIENRRQPQAASKQGFHEEASGQGIVRRHDGDHDNKLG
ncbi:hypothetical protein ACFWZU_09980 [Frateuria sp. GZRR33]|uniref:hypothetical protein n=1 Tax=Frateuria sp. GZRR33 TaxID=3351535 RepID=UPI003EDC8148